MSRQLFRKTDLAGDWSYEEQRFWSKVSTGHGCWLWLGARHNRKGYGSFRVGGRCWLAHRVAYLFGVGPIPLGSHVLHTCDNPSCVRPGHLYLGSNVENVADRVTRGRSARGSANGRSKVTPDQVVQIREDSRSSRVLAEEMGLSKTTILNIRSGKTWGHV